LVSSDPAEWRYALEVNVLGAYYCLRTALPAMLARGWGRIVNLSSVVAGLPAIRHRSAYVVSKAALDRLTVAASAELAGTGVTVNTVYPGMTDTPMLAQIRDAPVDLIGPEQQALVRQHYASGTLNQPAEVGRLIAAVVVSSLEGQVVQFGSEQSQGLLRQLPHG
jgi:NAD(P)-dependent dehydrogenase (short-subunit alcohol dehydrogenase family)